MISMSLDASTTHIGYAIFDEDDLIDYGRLSPTKKGLDWKERVKDFLPQVKELISKYNPTKIYQEQVPMGGKGGSMVLSQLFYLQGALMVIEDGYDIEYITVGQWRKNIGINDGDKTRDSKKIRSIQKANELFNLDLPLVFTKNGNYCEAKSNDDTSDAILLYASTRDKYKCQTKTFGRR